MRIDTLKIGETNKVAAFLREIDPSLFDGLPLDSGALMAEVTKARRDHYWGIWDGSVLHTVFFLRGLDAGYVTPAFGVAVAPAAQRRGLGHLALVFAETWSRWAGLKEIMLTVSDGNKRAITIYEKYGFIRTSERSAKGNLIYRKSIRE